MFIFLYFFSKFFFCSFKKNYSLYKVNIAGKIFFLFSIIFTLYLKPKYGFFFVLFFLLEYFFFLGFVFTYFKNKKQCVYSVITIDKYSSEKKEIFELWISYNKINAFARFYSLLLKKKINFFNFAKAAILLLLGIPIKIIIFLKKIILNNEGSVYERMLWVHDDVYAKYSNCKIEIFKNKTYLNGFKSIKHFVNFVRTIDPNIENQKIFWLAKELQNYNRKLLFENKYLTKIASTNLEITTKEHIKVPLFHPGFVYDMESRKFNKNALQYNENTVTIHATSNTHQPLTPTQLVAGPVSGLVKGEALYPGIIFTKSPLVVSARGLYKSILKIDLEKQIFAAREPLEQKLNIDFQLDYGDELQERWRTLNEIIDQHLNVQTSIRKKFKNDFLNEIMGDGWNDFFLTLDDNLLIYAINSASDNGEL